MRISKVLRVARSGVTLIELVLAFLILVIAALSASGLISFGHRGTMKDFRRVESIQLLTDRINRLSELPFKTLSDFLSSSGSDEYTFTDAIEGIPLGDTQIGKNAYSVEVTLKRQPISFPPIMYLHFPNSNYLASDVNTWLFEEGSEIRYDGVERPVKVLKLIVSVQPTGQITEELKVSAMTFVVDLES